MLLEKFLDYFLAENIRDSPLVVAPLLGYLIEGEGGQPGRGVRPKQVAEDSEVGDLGRPRQFFDLLQTLQFGAQPPVHAQNFVVDEGGHREVVEEVDELLPQLHGVPSFALVPEPVDLGNILALVVAPQHKHFVGVLYFVREQQANGLDALLPPVDVIAQKQILGLGRRPCVIEKSQQVKVLPMDICANRNRCAYLQQHRLRLNNFQRLMNNQLYSFHLQIDIRPWLFILHR